VDNLITLLIQLTDTSLSGSDIAVSVAANKDAIKYSCDDIKKDFFFLENIGLLFQVILITLHLFIALMATVLIFKLLMFRS